MRTTTRRAAGRAAIVTLVLLASGVTAVAPSLGDTTADVKDLDDAATAAAAADALVVHDIGDVRGNVTLPDTGDSGATVAWSSSAPEIISPAGDVHRPAHGDGAASVTMTATVTYRTASASRDFTATVPELPAKQPLKGYLFSYFTGEGTADGEQVYNALSNGNDPLSWREINNARPVLTSTLGT